MIMTESERNRTIQQEQEELQRQVFNGRKWTMGYMLKGDNTMANIYRCFDCHGLIDGANSISVRRQVSGPAHNDPPEVYAGDFDQRNVHVDRRECYRERKEQEVAEGLYYVALQSIKDSRLGVVVPKPLKGEYTFPSCWNCMELGVDSSEP